MRVTPLRVTVGWFLLLFLLLLLLLLLLLFLLLLSSEGAALTGGSLGHCLTGGARGWARRGRSRLYSVGAPRGYPATCSAREEGSSLGGVIGEGVAYGSEVLQCSSFYSGFFCWLSSGSV